MNTLRVAAIALAVALFGHLNAAVARDNDADPEALIKRGLDLRRAGRSTDALALFRRAYEADPSPRTLGQMGLVESSLQLWSDADAHLAAALATPEDAWVQTNRQFLDQAMDRTTEHIGELMIVGPPGTRVSLGGRAIGALPISAPVRLVEGDVAVTATSAGHKPYAIDISIKGGARAAISIVLDPIDLGPRDRETQPLLSADRRDKPTRTRLQAGAALAVAGIAGLSLGLVWIALDGHPVCDSCINVYDTRTRGIVVAGSGAALALAGGALLFSVFHTSAANPTVGLAGRSLRFEARF
jgi:tetratricopeptide (TPR) repeat protein